MTPKDILFDVLDERIAVITLNRPQSLHAISFNLRKELEAAADIVEKNTDIRALIVTGSGEKAFSAGADVHEMAQAKPEEVTAGHESLTRLIWQMAALRVPTIGAINGLAYGGGALLASTFDIRIGCENTKFRFLAAQYGRVNSTWSLPAIVGWAKAKELIYTCRRIDAEEAVAIGLLNRVVSATRLRDSAIEMAQQISNNAPESVQLAKRLMDKHIGKTWNEMYRAELEAISVPLTPELVESSFAGFLSQRDRNKPRKF